MVSSIPTMPSTVTFQEFRKKYPYNSPQFKELKRDNNITARSHQAVYCEWIDIQKKVGSDCNSNWMLTILASIWNFVSPFGLYFLRFLCPWATNSCAFAIKFLPMLFSVWAKFSPMLFNAWAWARNRKIPLVKMVAILACAACAIYCMLPSEVITIEIDNENAADFCRRLSSLDNQNQATPPPRPNEPAASPPQTPPTPRPNESEKGHAAPRVILDPVTQKVIAALGVVWFLLGTCGQSV